MKRLTYYLCGILLLLVGIMPLSAQSQYKDTLVVARDGSGDYRTLTEAMEGIRAFMDYKVTVLIKNGTYKEKAIIPSGCKMWISSVKVWKIRLSRMMTMPTLIRWVLSVPIL